MTWTISQSADHTFHLCRIVMYRGRARFAGQKIILLVGGFILARRTCHDEAVFGDLGE